MNRFQRFVVAMSAGGMIAIAVDATIAADPEMDIVDTAVVGQIPDPAYIGAVAVGALVFSFIFWLFVMLIHIFMVFKPEYGIPFSDDVVWTQLFHTCCAILCGFYCNESLNHSGM